MRIANVNGRPTILTGVDRGIDVESASNGKYGRDWRTLYENWGPFRDWAEGVDAKDEIRFTRSQLGSPSPQPRQIVATGLNYRSHVAEAGFTQSEILPPTFTKFPSSLAGPDVEVAIPPDGKVDWEVELVLIIGKTADNVEVADAWQHIAGVTIGQDITERGMQFDGPHVQWCLPKSFPNFSPVGPWLVTADELQDRNDLRMTCAIDGGLVQDARTSGMIFAVDRLLSTVSETITLYPGDIMFTGTPDGVGMAQNPQRWLQPGEVLVSSIEDIGEMRQVFVKSSNS